MAEINVCVADCSGFCFGVKRAIRTAEEALKKNKTKKVYSLGPLIHNSQVVENLSGEGLVPVKNLDSVKEGVVVISSHGTRPATFEDIKTKGLDLVDATCPYVMSAQKIVKSLRDDGFDVIIFGDSHHPEVEALIGFAGGEAIVVRDEKDIDGMDLASKKIGIVSQTTQLLENYLKIISKVLTKEFSDIRIFNTICNDTKKRQESAARLAKEADIMIVAGGKMSANTKRLFEICLNICAHTYHVETADELKEEWFCGDCRVGIASGASTPDWIIESIKNKILMTRGKHVNG